MQRGWKGVLALMLAFTVFASGCASGNEGSGANNGAGSGPQQTAGNNEGANGGQGVDAPSEPTTINWWAAWAEDAGPADIISKFNEQYPHITVEYVQFTNTDEGNVKIDTSLLAAKEIDVFFNFGAMRFDPRAKAGLLEDLTPYMERDGFNPEEEFGSVIRHGSQLFGLPVTSLNNAVYVNQKLLDEAQLTLPETWTLQEYADYAAKLTKGEGASKVYGSADFHSNYYWTMPVRGLLGGDFWYKADGSSNFDHPAFRESLETKHRLENVEKVQFPFAEYAATKMQTFDVFMQERSAMAIASNAMTRFLRDTQSYPRDFTATVMPMPTLSEAQDVNYNEGIYPFAYLSMSAKAGDKEAAWQFMNWLGTEGSKYLAQVGHLPTWKKSNQDEIMQVLFGDEPEKVVDVEAFKRVVLNFDGAGYQDTMFKAYGEINKIHQDEAGKYLFDAAKLDETIESIVQKANDAIQAAKQ